MAYRPVDYSNSRFVTSGQSRQMVTMRIIAGGGMLHLRWQYTSTEKLAHLDPFITLLISHSCVYTSAHLMLAFCT